MLGALMDTKGACFNPAPIHDGQEVTGKVPVCSQVNEQKNIQDKMNLENIQKGTIVTEHGTKEPENDSILSDLDNAIIRARTAALKAASFNQEKQKQPGARASIDEESHTLFGVQLPAGSDMAAVGVMIARKKAGKLDVKSPLGYLASISGKVAPVESKCTPGVQMNPVGMLVEPTIGISSSVTETRLDDVTVDRITQMWLAMDDEQRTPYREKAQPRYQSQVGKYKVPIELLARSEFNTEQLRNRPGGGR